MLDGLNVMLGLQFWSVGLESNYFENSFEILRFFYDSNDFKCLYKCNMLIYLMILLFIRCLYYVEVIALLSHY